MALVTRQKQAMATRTVHLFMRGTAHGTVNQLALKDPLKKIFVIAEELTIATGFRRLIEGTNAPTGPGRCGSFRRSPGDRPFVRIGPNAPALDHLDIAIGDAVAEKQER
ncbi:MAG: hypothetical protein E5X56_15890 [Mesorhizobium sp.]|uniref:hypothetical protein n=1 Tax=Mesorhizobium sp. TaxID=1871066 RepID=UPI0012281728|nr:hypothetical protein [Mesorhizobium sp.]TIP58294.1 MAG: hypothetical protein E5X56_15890 [Mesorhizobium sp.]